MDRKLSGALLTVVILLTGVPQLWAAGPFIVAHGPVASFTSSTGNLYWSSRFLNEFGPSSVSVSRAGKDNIPGNERALYVRSGFTATTVPSLGTLVYANLGEWFGYFVSTAGGTSRIIRVPLAGGPATTIPASPAGFIRDLKTDGAHLYWLDGGGIRRVDMNGGGAATIVNMPSLSRLGLDATRVYFVAGNSIRSVAKSGGAVTTIAPTSSAVSDLYVHVAEKTTVFWAEENGSVRSRTIGGGSSVVHQAALSGRRASSVGFDGGRVLWIDCTAPGNSFCSLRSRRGTTTSTIVASAGVGARNLAWDQTQVFWIDSGIKKFVY
jgi:hypothetical protein